MKGYYMIDFITNIDKEILYFIQEFRPQVPFIKRMCGK